MTYYIMQTQGDGTKKWLRACHNEEDAHWMANELIRAGYVGLTIETEEGVEIKPEEKF